MNIYNEWDISPEVLSTLANNNKSLKGMLLGYVAELKFRDLYFPTATKIPDQSKTKGDWLVVYKDKEFKIECKTITTSTINLKKHTARCSCSNKDKIDVVFSDKSIQQSHNLRYGYFDVLAICLFPYTKKWDFLFIANKDLPNISNSKKNITKYTELQRSELIAQTITVPLHPTQLTVTNDIYGLLDTLD